MRKERRKKRNKFSQLFLSTFQRFGPADRRNKSKGNDSGAECSTVPFRDCTSALRVHVWKPGKLNSAPAIVLILGGVFVVFFSSGPSCFRRITFDELNLVYSTTTKKERKKKTLEMFLENVTNGRCDFTLKHLPCWAICFSLPFPCFSAHAPQWNLHVPAGSFSYTAVRKLCALGNTTRHAILLLALVGFNTFGLFIDSIDIPLANRSTRPEIDMALCIFCRIPLHVSAFCENLVCRGKLFQMNQCQQ